MREAGISLLVARKRGRTTIRVPGIRVADDLVERQFRPAASDVLAELDEMIAPLVAELAPRMLERVGFGVQLLVTAGDNPDRLSSEAAFAMLCGSAPLAASSGQT
jgi:hypothetical protein